MKALLLTVPSQLALVNFPDPATAKDEVLLGVRACDICGSEIHGWAGSTVRRRPPLMTGSEAAGGIDAVGPDVPGWCKTSQNAVMDEAAEWVKRLGDKIPLRRRGSIDELGGALVFLARKASRYVTGQTLLVDGGITVNATRALPVKK